jgi:hemerythrin
MALIEWNDGLKIGIGVIDDQHKQLVKLTNELNDAMKSGKAKAVLSGIVGSLTRYTVTHFSEEERYFDKFSYPKGAGHKKEHSDFVTKVSGFQKGLDEGKIALSIEVVNFLAQWLKDHIAVSDKAYAPFFLEHGLR